MGADDAVAQTDQVVANLLEALSGAGAGPDDVVKTTVYVAGAEHERQSAVWKAVQFPDRGGAEHAGGRVVWGYRGQLVEIEAVAVLEGCRRGLPPGGRPYLTPTGSGIVALRDRTEERMTASSASETMFAGTQAPLLEVVGLTKSFGPLMVLRDVSLSIRRGEVLALVGENGAGKSSLVSCLARILEPEAGEVRLDGTPMPETPEEVRRAGVEVLWQDHGLCDNLDVVANVFLGRERRRWFAENGMREEATGALRRVGAEGLPLDREVRTLSRGQRQLVALGRAVLPEPRVLILDEPTASLGVVETLRIQALIREIRAAGAGILLVSHDLEQVFGLADRVVVLRQGRVVADVSPLEVHREDLVALMSGIEMDSVARRQLHRLRSLVDQLSDVEPGASLPLIVSAMAAALDQDMLCVHLLEISDEGERSLRRSAAVGLPAPLLRVNERLPIGPGGACAGLAAEVAEVVVVDDLWTHPVPDGYREAAAASGVRSEWAAPIVGTRGVLGTVSGYGMLLGTPEPERLELARLYLNYAASAIERERLLSEVSRRNRVLESLRGMLETLAGPERVEGGLGVSLVALSRAASARTRWACWSRKREPWCSARRTTTGATRPTRSPGGSARPPRPSCRIETTGARGSSLRTWRPCRSGCPRGARRWWRIGDPEPCRAATRSSSWTTPPGRSRWRWRARPWRTRNARRARSAGRIRSSESSCRG